MSLWSALKLRRGAAAHPEHVDPSWEPAEWIEEEREGRDVKRLLLVLGLGTLSWVATYVGMLELIEANLGDLSLAHKVIIGCSVAMLMTMIIWLLDKMFSPVDGFTRLCYIAGYLFLSLISVGFGFGFYWKVLESRGEASRSAESAISQVESSLFAASTRLTQLQSTLDQLTKVSEEKAEVERTSGKSCPNSGPGDGPRRKMREDDAARFRFSSDFVKGRADTVKSDMSALDGDLQKIVKDDRSVIDPRTGTRNEFLRAVGRKLDLTVTGFNAFRTDPQLKQIRTDLADRAEKSTISGPKGVVIHCPDAQLQMALHGVVRAIDQLPELENPRIEVVEGPEATIEAFRRLTTSLFGLLSFKLPPSPDDLRAQQRQAAQSVEASNDAPGRLHRAAFVEQAAGLAKRDYVPLAIAIFVDICLLLVSIGRPVNQFLGLERRMREARNGPVYPILTRFRETHADDDAVKPFEVFRDVIFDVNGKYHVAVPLNIPKHAPERDELRREAHAIANLCYALEAQGKLKRPMRRVRDAFVERQLKRRTSKFVECYGNVRPARYKRGWQALRSVWAETPHAERPAFKVYMFRKGAWPEMILNAVMGAARHLEDTRGWSGEAVDAADRVKANGYARKAADSAKSSPEQSADFGRYAHQQTRNGAGHVSPGDAGHFATSAALSPEVIRASERREAAAAALNGHHASALSGKAATPANGSLRDALAHTRLAEREQANDAEPSGIEVERISGWFRRSKGNA